MTHSDFDDLYELYVLGLLEEEPAVEIAQHLRGGCDVCSARVTEAVALTAALSSFAEPATLPPGLRKRILALAQPAPKPRGWVYALTGVAAACLALAIFAWSSRETAFRQTAAALRERDELRSVVAVLSRPETRAVQFGIASNPHGRVFVNRDGSLVFIGSNLPQLASGRTFELWLIPSKGAPQPLSLFQADSSGTSVAVPQKTVDLSHAAAVAVSVEPLRGSPAPTTKPILLVSLS